MKLFYGKFNIWKVGIISVVVGFVLMIPVAILGWWADESGQEHLGLEISVFLVWLLFFGGIFLLLSGVLLSVSEFLAHRLEKRRGVKSKDVPGGRFTAVLVIFLTLSFIWLFLFALQWFVTRQII